MTFEDTAWASASFPGDLEANMQEDIVHPLKHQS